jgi:diguanylate cyclase (GGDEF)-like protein/PAS domain S-box-containing protein
MGGRRVAFRWADVVRNLPRLKRLAKDSRTPFSAATASGSKRSDAVLLIRAIAYLQLVGAGLAIVWLLLLSVGGEDKRGMISVALVAAVFAATLLRTPVRISSRWLTPVALISTVLLGGYTLYGGDTATAFALLYVVAAGPTSWFLSGLRTIVQIGWMVGIYALALWFSRSPGEPPWPQLSGRDFGVLLVATGALSAATLLIRVFRRRIVEGDEQSAAIVESSQDAIIGADCDGVINVWNPAAERLYGYAASEAIGQPVRLLFPPARRGEEQTVLGRALAGGKVENYQTERVCKDGSVVIVSLSVSPIHDPVGRVIGASSITRDVTSAIRAQQQVTLQAALLDDVDAAVVFLDVAGAVRYWSSGAERLYGYSSEEAIGHTLADLIMPEESRAEMQRLRSGVLGGQSVEWEADVHDKQGRVFPVYVRIRPVRRDEEEGAPVIGDISVSVDISARREAEAAAGRYFDGQREVADIGRLALLGASLDELFGRAMDVTARVLSVDCAELSEWCPDTLDFVITATAGWSDARRGARIAGDSPASGLLRAMRSQEPFVVEDWEQVPGVVRSSELVARGVRSSVGVPVGERNSPLGVLSVHYTQPGAAPADCVPFLDSLANVLADAIRSHNAQEKIRHDSLHDGLTGLPNRTLFLDRVEHALASNGRRSQPLAVFFIDLDRFKLVNDSLGHEAGDELLRLVATRLASEIRPSDTLARLDGDEFAVLCEQLPSKVTATRIADQLMAAVEKPLVLNGNGHMLSASIGIALNTGKSSGADVLRDADSAMNHAKTAGGGRVELFDEEIRARVVGRVRTESALRAALAAEDQVYVDYQPLVSLRSGQIVGAEALARWRHPDWGPVSPVEFIPVAEDSGLIHQLGEQVMRRAARECAAWQDHPDFAGIAVNVSIRQLIQPDEVARLVRDVTAAEGIPPGFLTLEMTESVLIEQLDAARNTLASLGDLGVHLSLDDFGTGYSSLSYLAELPFDSVKIDRSLIRNVLDTPRADVLAATIIHGVQALDKQVIAEGVETREQANRLQALGCDIAQGFYFAKPMAPNMLTALLQDRPSWLPSSAKPPQPQPQRAVMLG